MFIGIVSCKETYYDKEIIGIYKYPTFPSPKFNLGLFRRTLFK